MHYFGGKYKVRKIISKYINEINLPYYEPFVGAGWILAETTHKLRYASDSNKYLIAMYQAMQQGWIPPTHISEEQYKYTRLHKDEDPALTAFTGFACSFAGKWFGGYARDSKHKNYAQAGHNTLVKRFERMKSAQFSFLDYRNLTPVDGIVYCDPPYNNTTQFNAVGNFNTEEFWYIMREWSKSNIVFVSEYTAPEWATCILEIPTATSIRGKNDIVLPRTERLYRL